MRGAFEGEQAVADLVAEGEAHHGVDVGSGLAQEAEPAEVAGFGVEAGDVGGGHRAGFAEGDVDVSIVGDGGAFERDGGAAGSALGLGHLEYRRTTSSRAACPRPRDYCGQRR